MIKKIVNFYEARIKSECGEEPLPLNFKRRAPTNQREASSSAPKQQRIDHNLDTDTIQNTTNDSSWYKRSSSPSLSTDPLSKCEPTTNSGVNSTFQANNAVDRDFTPDLVVDCTITEPSDMDISSFVVNGACFGNGRPSSTELSRPPTSMSQLTIPKEVEVLQSMLDLNAKPTVSSIRQIIHLLDVSEEDFSDELEMQRLREKVVNLIHENRRIQSKIEEADRRIGSLVRNFALTSTKQLLESLKMEALTTNNQRSIERNKLSAINEFTAEGRSKLKAYQHLFYEIQTQPQYLARLFVHEPKGRLSRLQQTCLYSLFNCSTTDRESYLLVNLFKAAIEEEVKTQISAPFDLIRGNPISISMAIDLYRSKAASRVFKSLQPLIEELIHTKGLRLSTDPIDMYRTWLADTETLTGEDCKLPHDVTVEKALEYREVRERLKESIDRLLNYCCRFMEIFLTEDFIADIPFGLRYLARVLFELLREKFPNSKKNDLLKVISNFIYYRFIGTCIFAPEVFGIVKLKPGENISTEARLNLGNISKLLNAASSGSKGYNFGIEMDFYESLGINSFLKDSFTSFTDFFRAVTTIEPPEVYFDVNRFTDEALIFPPQITLKLREIYELHHWLYEMKPTLAPNSDDILHELLSDCGPPPPSLSDMFNNKTSTLVKNSKLSKARSLIEDDYLGSADITLVLTSKNTIKLDCKDTVSVTNIKVKTAIIELIKFRTSCSDFNELLFKPITESENAAYLNERKKLHSKLGSEMRNKSIIFSPFGESLTTLLNFVQMNLKSIHATNFDEISSSIVKDIKTRVDNREFAKNEIVSMRETLLLLEEKKTHSVEVYNYYKKYIKQCCDNLASMTKSSNKKTKALKYSGEKLIEKGILIPIKPSNARLRRSSGLYKRERQEEDNLRILVFEISPVIEESGVFVIVVKFKGLELYRIKIELQHLLELQFKGVLQLKLIEESNIKVNVNLMIYLLNKKFYSKKS